MIKYFEVQCENKQVYTVEFTAPLYEFFKGSYVNGAGSSYKNIYYRLFGLLPYDYFHYIAFTYKAKFKKMSIRWMKTYFENKTDAERFANECNKRMNNALRRKDNGTQK